MVDVLVVLVVVVVVVEVVVLVVVDVLVVVLVLVVGGIVEVVRGRRRGRHRRARRRGARGRRHGIAPHRVHRGHDDEHGDQGRAPPRPSIGSERPPWHPSSLPAVAPIAPGISHMATSC